MIKPKKEPFWRYGGAKYVFTYILFLIHTPQCILLYSRGPPYHMYSLHVWYRRVYVKQHQASRCAVPGSVRKRGLCEADLLAEPPVFEQGWKMQHCSAEPAVPASVATPGLCWLLSSLASRAAWTWARMEDAGLQRWASRSAVPASVPDPHSQSFDSEAHCGLLSILLLSPATGIALRFGLSQHVVDVAFM